MDNNLQIFIPFSKKDEDKHMVYGYASTESVDSQGEIVSKKAIAAALPDYMKFGNIREMHQPSAVGKAKSAQIDHKGLFLSAKVVDKGAWEKVKEGVYNGFSIGGRKLAQVGNTIKSLALSEISLVDRPANPDAVFTMVKMADGKAEKYGGEVAVSGKEDKEQEALMDMFDASYILNMAKELAYLVMTYKNLKKPTKKLESAIENLKQAAKDNLGKADYDSLCNFFDTILAVDFTKKADEYTFAYKTHDGKEILPLMSLPHVKKSIAMFSQVVFSTELEKQQVANKILNAAKHYGLEVSRNSQLYKDATGEAGTYIWENNNWEADYYNQQRKVLG